jgi:hypothetical protein
MLFFFIIKMLFDRLDVKFKLLMEITWTVVDLAMLCFYKICGVLQIIRDGDSCCVVGWTMPRRKRMNDVVAAKL